MTIKNIKKNISAEPEHIVTNITSQESNPPQNATQGAGNFNKNLAIEITKENFYNEENRDTRVATIIIPLSELVRIGHLQSQYYTKTEIEGIRANYYDKTTSDEKYVAKGYLLENYDDRETTETKINNKVDTEINTLNTEIHEEFYTIEQITQLLASLQVGRGKLVTFYIDEANGDIVVQDDGFTYYTTEESDEKFNIDIEELSTNDNGILKSYQFVQGTGNSRRVLETKINIPKDFLLKNVALETARTGNSQNIPEGHKYFDFVFNTKNNDGDTTHLYLDVHDLTDIYSGDEETIHKSGGNVFSVKKITPSHINGVLGLEQVTHQDISGKVDKIQGKGLSTEDFTTEEKQKLNGIEDEATKTIIDTDFNENSSNPIRNSTIYRALQNINDEYIYIDKLGNIHALKNVPTEIILNSENGMLSVEVIGKNIFNPRVDITDAYVDIYDSQTDEYIFTVTSLEEPFYYEVLANYSSIYGKIRDVKSDDIIFEMPELRMDEIIDENGITVQIYLVHATCESGSVILKSGDAILESSLELEEPFNISREQIAQLRDDNGKISLTAELNDCGLNLSTTRIFEVE